MVTNTSHIITIIIIIIIIIIIMIIIIIIIVIIIQHLLFSLRKQLSFFAPGSQILSYITFITKFNCTFKNTVNTKVLDK